MKYIILVFLIFLLTNCTKEKAESVNKNLSLAKVDSVKLVQGQELFGKFFEQIKFTDDGAYWLFSERILNKIFVFDKKGNLHSTIGEKGKGPSGLIQVTGYDINNKNEILIYDSSQRMFKLFDLNGNLISTTSVLEDETYNPTANNISWYKDKILTSIYDTKTGFKTENSRLFSLINKNGDATKVFGKFDPFSKNDNQLTFNTLLTIDEKSGLVYSNLQTSPYYQIHEIESGKLISYEGVQTKSFKIPAKVISPYLPLSEKFELSVGISGMMHIFLTERYFIQHMQILTEEWFETTDYTKKKNLLVIYDRESHKFIRELPVDHTPIGAFNNQLFFVEDFDPDNFEIGVYEIIEN